MQAWPYLVQLEQWAEVPALLHGSGLAQSQVLFSELACVDSRLHWHASLHSCPQLHDITSHHLWAQMTGQGI